MSASSDLPVVLALTGRAVEVRRCVEPMSWLVLEELALRLHRSTELPIGVRSIAADLGRSPDAVGRALRLLIEVGLVERRTERELMSGRFGAATYSVDLESAGLQLPSTAVSAARTTTPPPRTRATRPNLDEQLFQP